MFAASLILLASLTAPGSPALPGPAFPQKGKSLPKVPAHKGKPPVAKLDDRVGAIPGLPAGVKAKFVPGALFEGRKRVRSTSEHRLGEASGFAGSFKPIRASATFRLPVGARPASLDCRVDVKRSGSDPGQRRPTAHATLSTFNYRTPQTSSGFVETPRLADLKLTMTRTTGMYWRTVKITGAAAAGAEDTYRVTVDLHGNQDDQVMLRGCRVGYRD
ncbi:MAG: hypothetical protein AAGA54_03705 [Myxococcota bacterium]